MTTKKQQNYLPVYEDKAFAFVHIVEPTITLGKAVNIQKTMTDTQ